MKVKLKKLNIETVLVDIDTTLTDPRNVNGKDKQVDFLASLVVKKTGISLNAAKTRIKELEELDEDRVGRYWPFGILNKLNVSENELWTVIKADAKARLFMHADAKVFLVGLKERYPELKVYTATTNPRMIIYAKLAVVGLADKCGSPFLDGAFGGEEVFSGGKLCPEFYTAILQRTGSNPETTMMVGDSPEMDLALAKAAGIEQVILVRREQEDRFMYEVDGGIYVKRLDFIFDLMV